MSRLVVISNRVADPRKPAAGGLAVALGESLQQSGGMWFGWSGQIVEDGPTGEGELRRQQAGKVTLATIDLSREDHDSYYLGYSNDVLWPVFHDRLDLAHFDANFIGGYRRVNQLFARKLMPLLKEDDVIWVHDYHLIPLAAELRAMGCRQRIGFFLHIPLPPQIILAAIPQHEWLMRSLFAYDLIGFQAQQDVQHFEHYVHNEAKGESLGAEMYRAYGNTVRAAAFPIGIDVDEFAALTHAKEARDMYETMKREYSQRRLLLGIDRLDYSKGIPNRVRAFRELLAHYPENRRSATLIQIASPTRETVDAYADIRRELESLCGAINGDYGELDWMPVRYIHRMVARKRVPGLCRAAAVGLVDAAARRHEPGRQGVRGGAGPGRPRRAGAVALRGRGRADAGSAAGQSLRHPRHRRDGAAGAADAAGGTPRTAPGAALAHPRAGHPLVAAQLPRDAARGGQRALRRPLTSR